MIDSVLVIADKVEDRTLLLYNMKDSTYVRTLSVGNGPGEVIVLAIKKCMLYL